MSENPTPIPPAGEGAESAPVTPPPPKRGPGHRGQDIRDTMAEMAAKAHEISLEAGSRMAGTMREVIGAAAGISAFAIESARDLVNYMVRRGQMSQDEASKLMKEVEEAHANRPKVEPPARKAEPAAPKATPRVEAPRAEAKAAAKPAAAKAEPKADPKAPAKAVAKTASKAAAPKPAAKAAAKPTAKAAPKPVAKASKPVAKKAAKKK
jgi:hypothetical protein